MDSEARDAFDGFSAMFNIRGHSLRRGKEADKSAEEGIAPWKIGMLAACLLLWDIMWKVSFAASCFGVYRMLCMGNENHGIPVIPSPVLGLTWHMTGRMFVAAI